MGVFIRQNVSYVLEFYLNLTIVGILRTERHGSRLLELFLAFALGGVELVRDA